MGLLIKTWGSVTHSDSGFFYIDDGSNLSDGSVYTGLKIQTNGAVPGQGEMVTVTGISSCYQSGDGKTHRLVRIGD